MSEFFLEVIRQRLCIDVEAQVNRGGNFVDVLPARALRADRMQFDLGVGDSNVPGYLHRLLDLIEIRTSWQGGNNRASRMREKRVPGSEGGEGGSLALPLSQFCTEGLFGIIAPYTLKCALKFIAH